MSFKWCLEAEQAPHFTPLWQYLPYRQYHLWQYPSIGLCRRKNPVEAKSAIQAIAILSSRGHNCRPTRNWSLALVREHWETNRPGVAGAVLQSPLSLIHSFIH